MLNILLHHNPHEITGKSRIWYFQFGIRCFNFVDVVLFGFSYELFRLFFEKIYIFNTKSECYLGIVASEAKMSYRSSTNAQPVLPIQTEVDNEQMVPTVVA